MAPSPGSSRIPLGTVALLGLATVLYLAMMMSLGDARHTDAAGRGMALGIAAILGTAMMILLAVLLVVAAVKGEMSVVGKIGALFVVPVATVAIWVAGGLYGDRTHWVVLVPALLPILFAAYALRARLPSLRARLGTGAADFVLGGAILLVTAAPLVWIALPPSPAALARVAAQERARADREAKDMRPEEKRAAEAFARLGPDSSLRDYLQYLPGGDSRSRDALAGARQVKSRQANAVALLKAGRLDALTDLFRLDLQPTPELCRAYGDALTVAAGQVTKARPDHLSIAIDLEQQVPNVKWLVEGGCNLNAALDVLAGHVRAVSNSRRMETFANTLDAERR